MCQRAKGALFVRIRSEAGEEEGGAVKQLIIQMCPEGSDSFDLDLTLAKLRSIDPGLTIKEALTPELTKETAWSSQVRCVTVLFETQDEPALYARVREVTSEIPGFSDVAAVLRQYEDGWLDVG